MAELSEAELALLASLPLFDSAPPDAALRAAGHAACLRLERRKGETIYTPHAFSRSLGVLLSGRVQVSKGALPVSTLGPGDLFGAAALFNDRPDYAAVLTARSDCALLLFPQTMVEGLMADCPAIGRNYVRYLSGRVRFLERKIDGLIAGSAGRKLAQYCLSRQTGGALELDCSATALAARLHVSRASLYRALETLTAQSLLRREGKTLYILDEARLRSI